MPLKTLAATLTAPAAASPKPVAAAPLDSGGRFSRVLQQTTHQGVPAPAANAPPAANHEHMPMAPGQTVVAATEQASLRPKLRAFQGDPLKSSIKTKHKSEKSNPGAVALPPPIVATLNAAIPMIGLSGKSPGKAMDTSLKSGGELLPQSQTTLVSEQTPALPSASPRARLLPPATPTTPVPPNAAPTVPGQPGPAAALQAVLEMPGFASASPAQHGPSPSALPGRGGTQASAKPPAAGSLAAPLTLPKDMTPALQNRSSVADIQGSPQPGNTTGVAGVKSEQAHKLPANLTVAQDGTSKPDETPKAVTEGAAPMSLAALSSPTVTIAPSAMAPAMPAADRARMLSQVSDSVQTAAAQPGPNGQRQITLQLHPQDWGQLRVSITMTPTVQVDGKVSTQVVAHVVAEQSAVKTALETHQADLRQALRDAGLHLDRLTVVVQHSGAGVQAGLGDSRHQSGSGWGDRPPGSTNETNTNSGAASGGGGFSSFAAFGQGGGGSQGRPQAPPSEAPAGQPAGVETELPIRSSHAAGRVDTRA